MMEIIPWIIQRASEPLTWAGFAGLAVAFGLSQAEWAAVGKPGRAKSIELPLGYDQDFATYWQFLDQHAK